MLIAGAPCGKHMELVIYDCSFVLCLNNQFSSDFRHSVKNTGWKLIINHCALGYAF